MFSDEHIEELKVDNINIIPEVKSMKEHIMDVLQDMIRDRVLFG